MTIDSAAKRKTVSGIPFARSPGVTPNASKDQDWRFEAAGSYIGFIYGIDSAAKRKAISGIPMLPPGVTPDASHGIDWRLSAGLSYIGFVYNINTGEKRRAVAGLPFLPLGPNVTPNAAKDREWRSQSAWGYMVSGLVDVTVPKSRFFMKYVLPHGKSDKYRST